MIRGAISGAIWGGIAVAMAMTAGGREASIERLLWDLRGGLFAAPFIGIAMASCQPLFASIGFGLRAVVSLLSLYLAAFAFMLAARMTSVAAGGFGDVSLADALFNSVAVAFFALTWTGFVVILAPLAFLNHWWIARSGTAGMRADEPC
jgi:hypothetical protein